MATNRNPQQHASQGGDDQEPVPRSPVRIDRAPKEGRGLGARPARMIANALFGQRNERLRPAADPSDACDEW